MAEAAVVSALIDTFTPMVANKLSQDVSLIVNFRKDFEFFCEELFSIKCLLTDAGTKRSSSSVSNWLDSIEDFVADAEYLMEQCGSVDKFFAKLKFRLKMGHKIRELKERLKQIRGKAKDLKLLKAVLDVNAHGQARDADGFNGRRERSYALPQEPQIVGMDNEIKVITKWILKEDSPPVIAVVGMGGQGKTLLLQRVFNSEEIRQHFDHRVWLAISQKFLVMELLRQVLRELDPNHNSVNLTKGELIEKIHKKLEGKRCLFAVDDVWDIYAWEDIGLPSRIQDKVVVTTRQDNIAKAMGAGDQIHPKYSLSEENSWQLFCLHAFPDGAHHCPEALDKIAREIVKECGGLPLAIKTIGAYLARLVRGNPNDWEWTLHHLNEAHGMRDRVMPSLKLSYQALPPHLKPCFLYCSVFPKNTQIQSEYLVYAWIAQGFVSAKLEESYSVGRSYMDDLIDRCLIEVSEVGWDGRVQSCKMHDLLHDLAVSEQTKCLLKPGGQLERIPAEECQGLRRISLMKNEISTIQNGIRCPGLRSLLLSHNDRLTSISSSFFDNMRYLCVLDLSQTSITSLPDSIGNLRLLRYLNLSKTSIEKLPESLSSLRHLQFLDVQGTYVERLHSGIDKHKYMLHLNLGWRLPHCGLGISKLIYLHSCPVGISKLIYLHTLIGVEFTLGNAASANALQLRDLKGLTLLQVLSLTFNGESNLSGDHRLEDEGTFRGMTKMRTLYVRYNTYYGDLHLPTDMEAMERLEIVRLFSCVVPKWFFQLQNLMELTLEGPAYSSSADFRGLEKIPNLKKLHLEWNWNRDFIEFPNEFGERGAFLKLEELVIQDFKHLKSIPSFHEDAMPRLRCLRVIGCKPLENMPEGLTKLKNLKEVEVSILVDDRQSILVDDRWQSFKDRQIKIKVERMERKVVDSLENFEYGKRHCWQSLKDMLVRDVENEYRKRHSWQSLKDRQIKIKVELCDSSTTTD